MAITPEARSQRPEAGFALLIALIFMSVMLAFGLALGSLSYKQQVLAATAIQSQYAFYAADAALECALYADQQLIPPLFEYPPGDPLDIPEMTCDATAPVSSSKQWSATQWIVTNRMSLDSDTDTPRCADITVYKPNPAVGGVTYIFSQGYDVSCDTVEDPGLTRYVSRGINVRY